MNSIPSILDISVIINFQG